MATPKPTWSLTNRLLLQAMVLGLVVTFVFAAACGAFRSTAWQETDSWRLGWALVALTLSIAGIALNAFASAFEQSTRHSMASLAGAGLALLAGIEAVAVSSSLDRYFFFSSVLVGQMIVTYAVAQFLMSSLKLEGRWRQLPPLAALAVIFLFGCAGLVGQSWLSLERVAAALAVVRDILLLSLPVATLVACVFMPQLQLDRDSRRQSLLLRFHSHEMQRPLWWNPLLSTYLGIGATCLLGLVIHPALATTFSLGWLGIMLFGIHELNRFGKQQMQGQVAARLPTHSAKRFLGRYSTAENAWAATVGLRTTNFNIDHDPGSYLHSQLPASVMQLRNEEIQRCIADLLGGMYMHSHVVGPRISGAIDTEISIRPCTDTLKMFACLYLDAGPLVERRIKGLVSLLPIVDPGLARVLGSKDIGELIRRNLWFFHFDFGWIDQHVIHTPRATKYDVRIDGLASHSRYALIDHFERIGGTGNMIWLGPEARNRLIQEAPALRNIIEPCPIRRFNPNDPTGKSSDEMLMFTIRFEQLIPRLQRYFDLDTMRRTLLDFEPSADSRRTLHVLHLQANKARATDANTVSEVLSAITSVPWHGFKEKDGALQLILTVYNNLTMSLPPGTSLDDSDDPAMQEIYKQIIDAVRRVGYPSQILHDAQMSKLALRDVDSMVSVAGNLQHPRFHEAWLVMATTDFSRHSADQRAQILQFLANLDQKPRLQRERLVQTKAIDTVCGIGQHAKISEIQQLSQCLSQIGNWFSQQNVELATMCLYFDAHLFLNHQLQQGLKLPPATTAALAQYCAQAERGLPSDHPHLVALLSRWQELKPQLSPAAA